MSKKERKRLQREAEKEKAELESILGLTHAIEELESGRKKPKELEGIIAEAKTLAQQWKNPHSAEHPKDQRPLFDGTTGERTFLLAGLVVCLIQDHRSLELIRSFFPSELKKLRRDGSEILAGLFASKQPQLTPKRKYEGGRSSSHWGTVGLIEKEFGNERLDWWRKASEWVPLPILQPREPACLDDIFAGDNVNMSRLEKLFGMSRKRLAKLIEYEDKKRREYGYCVVVKVMSALLAKKPRKKRKLLTPGRPRQMPWLNDAALRIRVLSEIKARIKSIPMRDEIAKAFLSLVHRYYPDSGKN